jgi:hypothetical protein
MTAPNAVADEVVDLLRQPRLPHIRRHAPELLATAKAQRWDRAEAVRALLAEELAGRQRSRSGRAPKPPGSRPARRSTRVTRRSRPCADPRTLRLEWITHHENLVV